MELNNIVHDWGGFEELVKDLHENGEVEVNRDVTLTGASGVTRQIDVVLKHFNGPYEYLTLVECKYWTRRVKRENIDVLHSSMLDLNASKGVFFTTKGYQSGAETYAKAKGIEIFVVRDLTDEEWGLPGKVVDIYLQIISKTILDIELIDTKASFQVGQRKHNQANISLNFGDDKNNTLIVSEQKDKHKTLEAYLEEAANHAVSEFKKKPFLINSGEECTRYFQIDVNMPLKEKGKELQVLSDGVLIFIPKINLQVGIKVAQSRLVIDRSEKFIYTLAIEDCVNNNIYAAAKEKQDFTKWVKLKNKKKVFNNDVLTNGSIMTVFLSNFFDPKEMDGLKEVETTSNK